MPTIDLHKYWHALWPVLRSPSLPPEDLAHYIITWLFIAAIIDSLYGFRRFLPVFPLLVCIEFAGKVLIVGAFLKATDVVGGVAAYLLWVSPLRRVPGRSIVVAVAFAVMIALERLQPYQFLAAPREFGWIPFYSFMHGSIGIDMQAFCQKFYEYGGLIWLLGCCGVTLPSGTGLTAGLLLATSVAECWLPGRSAEITDGIMALVIGGAFVMLERAAWPRAAAALAPHRVSSQPPRRRGSKYGPYVPPRLRG